jgi:hypothetical protein
VFLQSETLTSNARTISPILLAEFTWNRIHLTFLLSTLSDLGFNRTNWDLNVLFELNTVRMFDFTAILFIFSTMRGILGKFIVAQV